MKSLFLLPVLLIASHFFQSETQNIEPETIKAANSDTCFYSLRLPADLDVPSTPHFDTTIVRGKDCKVHILKLQSWGTETEYRISATIGGKNYSRNAHFFHSYPPQPQWIDITDLPAGKYSGYLTACGNGGSFGLEIK